MSTNTSGSKNTSSSEGTGSITKNLTWQKVSFYVTSLIAVVFYITSFVGFGQFMASSDSYSEIKPQLTKISIFSLIATVFMIVAALLYFSQDPSHTMYFTLTVSCLALGMSYAALAVGAISR